MSATVVVPSAASRQVDAAPWRQWFWPAVVGLLMLFAAEVFLSARQESQTFDEPAHLYAGYSYWLHSDFGINPEHPPLVKLVAAVPLLAQKPHYPDPANIFFRAQSARTQGPPRPDSGVCAQRSLEANQPVYGLPAAEAMEWRNGASIRCARTSTFLASPVNAISAASRNGTQRRSAPLTVSAGTSSSKTVRIRT